MKYFNITLLNETAYTRKVTLRYDNISVALLFWEKSRSKQKNSSAQADFLHAGLTYQRDMGADSCIQPGPSFFSWNVDHDEHYYEDD